MASISLRALPGASLLMIPTIQGFVFRMENSGFSDCSQLQDALEILLTADSDGVRLSIVSSTSSSQQSTVPPPPPTENTLSWAMTTSPTANGISSTLPSIESSVSAGQTSEAKSSQYMASDNAAVQEDWQGLNYNLDFNELWSLVSIQADEQAMVMTPDGTSSLASSVYDFNERELRLPSEVLSATWPQEFSSASDPSSLLPSSANSPERGNENTPSTPPNTPKASSVEQQGMNPQSFPTADTATANQTRRRYPCRHSGCSRLFTREYTRKVHEDAHAHKLVLPLFCSEPGCSTTFSRPHDRLRHEVLKHGRSCNSCGCCGKMFSSERNLSKHKCHPLLVSTANPAANRWQMMTPP